MMTEQQYDRLERAATSLCEALLRDRRESRKRSKQLRAMLEGVKKRAAENPVAGKTGQETLSPADGSDSPG